MKEVDFYACSRAVQDRFIACLRGQGKPEPLLSSFGPPPREVFVGAAIAVAGAVSLVFFVRMGFGELESPFALQPVPLALAYALAIAAVAFGVLYALARLRADFALPYRPGVYLFPSGVIDARRPQMRVFSLSRLIHPVIEADKITLSFPEGEAYQFRTVPGRSAELSAAITDAEDELERAVDSGKTHDLGVLDPLLDVGVANPFAPKTPYRDVPPVWARFLWAAAALSGLVLAPGVWLARNIASDSAMLSRAHERRSAEAYRAYLSRGGKRKDVADVLLPRAELVDAVKEGTVEAVERYISTHPRSQIQSEVSASLRQAMLAELSTAKRAGTVAALNEFKKRHPHHLVDAEIAEAVHAVYDAALSRYRRESGVKDPAVLDFVERLLTFAEKSGPSVQIRFRRRVSHSMEVAEAGVKKSPFFMGTPSLPSPYFDDAHSRVREARAAQTIVARFAAAFAPDVLSVELGPAITDTDGPLPRPAVPTIFIEHTAELSGASYLSANPRGVFVGLGMVFDVTFRIPDDAKPQKFKQTAWRPPDTTVPKGDAESWEAAVYEAMAKESFAQFAQRYVVAFFPKAEAKTSE